MASRLGKAMDLEHPGNVSCTDCDINRPARQRRVLRSRPLGQRQNGAEQNHGAAADAVHPAQAPGILDHAGKPAARIGIGRDRDHFQAQEDPAEDEETDPVIAGNHELREKGSEDQDRLGVADGDQEFPADEGADIAARLLSRKAVNGQRRPGKEDLETQPDQIGGAQQLADREGQLRRHEQCSHAQRGHGDHDRKGDQAPDRGQNCQPQAVMRADGDGQQIVRPESHVQCKAGGNEQQQGIKRHDLTR